MINALGSSTKLHVSKSIHERERRVDNTITTSRSCFDTLSITYTITPTPLSGVAHYHENDQLLRGLVI